MLTVDSVVFWGKNSLKSDLFRGKDSKIADCFIKLTIIDYHQTKKQQSASSIPSFDVCSIMAAAVAISRNHPPGTQPGGVWYKQKYCGQGTQATSTMAFFFMGYVESSIVSGMSLDERYIYHDVQGSRGFYNIMGQGVDATKGMLSVVPPGLEPTVPSPRLAERAAAQPPGCRPGGLWYQQTLNGTKRYLYRQDPNGLEFFTKAGQKVDARQGSLVPPVNWYRAGHGKSVSGYEVPTVFPKVEVSDSAQVGQIEQDPSNSVASAAPESETRNDTTSIANANSSAVRNTIRHPPDTVPGGTWYKHKYSGQETSTKSMTACCFIGPGAAAVVSGMELDEEYIYQDKNTNRFHDPSGKIIARPRGSLYPLPCGPPAGIWHSRVYKKESNMPVPPGCQGGGLWYSQIVNGKSRVIYREVTSGTFYNKRGQKIDPRAGPIHPPVRL